MDGNDLKILERRGWSDQKARVFKETFREFLNSTVINSKDLGRVVLGEHLYRGQIRAVDDIVDGLVHDIHDFYDLKSRQLGFTTLFRIMDLFYLGIHEGLLGAIVMDTDSNKKSARREIETVLENLPAKIKFPRIKTHDRDGLTLENEATILFKNAGTKKSSTSGTLGRSEGLALSHCSELCSWDNDEGIEAYKNSLSEINPDRLYLWESTARGYNAWHEMYEEAKADIYHKKCLFYGWWSKDSQQIPRDDPDFERYGLQLPTAKEAEKIAIVRDRYGWQVTPEQLAWVRKKMAPAALAEGELPVEFEGSVLRIQEQPWCVSRETRIGTSAGIIPVDEVRPGMMATLSDVLHAGPTGKAQIWRAVTKRGYQIRGTANHPLITSLGEEVRIDSALGRSIILQPPRFSDKLYTARWRIGPVDHSVLITPEFARLIGLYMGDGSLCAGGKGKNFQYHIQITCDKKDEDVVQECAHLCRSLLDVEPWIGRSDKYGWVNVRASGRHIIDTFRALGLTRNDIGKTMRKVHVPEFIWRSPKHVVREFLRGLFEADGYAGKDSNRVAIFSKYDQFIKDIQVLLLGFGVTSEYVIADKTTGRKGKTYHYTGRQLECRTAAATIFHKEIGFISSRKIARSIARPYKGKWRNHKRPEISYFDEIVSVVNEGVEEEVFNLTVGGRHWFDCNGILTHNTEEEAWQMSGATFFSPESLKALHDNYVSSKYKGYWFAAGVEFIDMKVHEARTLNQAELKVWEEPKNECTYVICADVAHGADEDNDRSAISVLKCYADGCDQVAEYASPLVTTKQFAWIIMTLAAWYSMSGANVIYLIVELNGPGGAVWDEIRDLGREVMTGYQSRAMQERGLQNIFGNIRNYLYSRPDSLSSSFALMWKTTSGAGPSGKVRLMERFRDFVSNGYVHVRSADTVEEMSTVTRVGDTIEAEGSSKDDRVIAIALGIRCWEERARRNLSIQKKTREAEAARRRLSIVDQSKLYNDHMLSAVFAKKRVTRRREDAMLARMKWRGRI